MFKSNKVSPLKTREQSFYEHESYSYTPKKTKADWINLNENGKYIPYK